MHKRHVLAVMMGAALACGSALAQADGAPGQMPREGEAPYGCGPADSGRGNPGHRRPERDGFCAAERPDGREGPRMHLGEPERALPDPKRLIEAGATEEQLTALRKAREASQLKRIDLKAAVEKAELALAIQMKEEAVDEKAALKAVDALNQARGELFKLEISAQLRTHEILGTEVMKKLCERAPQDQRARPLRGPGPETEGRKGAPPAPAAE